VVSEKREMRMSRGATEKEKGTKRRVPKWEF
jgi:hypothetical protein